MSCLVHSSFFPTKEDHPFPPKQRQFRSTSWQEPSGKLGLSINTGSFYRSFFLFKLDFHLENFYHNSVTMIKSLPSFISFVSINALLQYPTQSLVKIDPPNPLAFLGIKPWTLLEYISYSLDQQSPLFS